MSTLVVPSAGRLTLAARTAAYFVVSLPIAVAYVAFVAVASVVSAVLMPVRIGAPIALWAADMVWRFATFERTLANRLLHARIAPLPPPVPPVPTWRGVRERVASPGFARGLGLVLAKLPLAVGGVLLGIGPVVLGVAMLGLGVKGIVSPSDEDYVGPWSLGASVGLLLCVVAVAAVVVGIAALLGLGAPVRRFARSLLLTSPEAGSPAREMLAESLGDVTLTIAYWLPDREVFVDESGKRVEMPEPGSGRAWTSVDSGGRRVAAIVHDAELDTSPELVQAAAATSALALDNERLKADLRARLEELRASRVRIVQAGDAARRRLERDLHDGAQQQLVALSIDLRLLKSRLGDDQDTAALVEAATQKLADALAELRELARGIHPAILTERGIGPAVEALARRMSCPVECDVDVPNRLPDAIEAAAYFVVSEGLANVAKYADAGQVHVHVAVRDGALEVEVIDDGRGGANTEGGSGLRGLADRVSALDGDLGVTSPPGRGTRLVARIPVPARAARPVRTIDAPARAHEPA